MKKVLAFMLVMFMCLSLVACGDAESSDSGSNKSKNKDKTSKVDISSLSLDLGEDAPNQKTVRDDINKAIEEKNRNVNITGLNVEKSITNEKDCEITLDIDGESNYADWKYQVIMEYTKYDQGWMLDNLEWVQESYDVVRMPDEKDFIEYVNNEYSGEHIENHLPVRNGEFNNRDFSGTGTVELSWTYKKEYKYAYKDTECTTYWIYNADSDSWEYDTSDIKYQTTPKEVDLSGNWEGTGLSVTSITITDFSWDGFSVTMNGHESYYTPGNPEGFAEEGRLWYTNGYMQIGIFLEDNIAIDCIRKSGSTLYYEFSAIRE